MSSDKKMAKFIREYSKRFDRFLFEAGQNIDQLATMTLQAKEDMKFSVIECQVVKFLAEQGLYEDVNENDRIEFSKNLYKALKASGC